MEKTEKRKSEVLKKQRTIWTITIPILIFATVLILRFKFTGSLDFNIWQILSLIIMIVLPGLWIHEVFSTSVLEEEKREKEEDEYNRIVSELERIFSNKLVHVELLHDKNFVESNILEQAEGMFSFYYFASMQDNKMILYIKNENHETIGNPIYISDLDEFWEIFDFEEKSKY